MAVFHFQSGLLRNVLKCLAVMADDANIFFEPDRDVRLKLVCFVGYVDGAVSLKKNLLVNFQCSKPASACIELVQLEKALEHFDQRKAAVFHFDTEELVLRVSTVRVGRWTAKEVLMDPTLLCIEEERCTEVALTEEGSEFMKIDESTFEYDLIIGIPSDRFSMILNDAEKHLFVTIYVKESEVWFKIKNKVFPLHKELGNFVHVGPTFDKPLVVEFALYRLDSFILASQFTGMVWLCWSFDAPPQLNFPIGTIGHIHIYSRLMPEKKPRRTPGRQL